MRQSFLCDIVTDLFEFPKQLSLSLYLLLVLRSESGSNVEDYTGIVRRWSTDVNFISLIFVNVGDWKLLRNSVDNSILFIFSIDAHNRKN